MQDITKKRIIYPQENGIVAVVIPTGELPLSELINRVVPKGVSYKIVNDTDIPTDRTFRSAWEYVE